MRWGLLTMVLAAGPAASQTIASVDSDLMDRLCAARGPVGGCACPEVVGPTPGQPTVGVPTPGNPTFREREALLALFESIRSEALAAGVSQADLAEVAEEALAAPSRFDLDAAWATEPNAELWEQVTPVAPDLREAEGWAGQPDGPVAAPGTE